MKKILSVIMVVAMLFTGIVPSMISVASAADTVAFALETAGVYENEETGLGNAELTLSLTNSAGASSYRVFVYYDTDYVDIPDYVQDEDGLPIGSMYPDLADISTGKRSSANAYKKYFTAAGITSASNIQLADIKLDAEGEVFEAGAVCTLMLETVEMFEDLPEGFSFEVGVLVAEVYDADGEELTAENFTFTVESAAGDPWAPVYDEEVFPEDQFTINVTGTNVYEGTVNEDGTLIAPVNIEFYGNNESNNVKGVWATRVFVYYPQEISLLGFENGKIYEDHNMNVGMLDDNILNPKLTNSAGVPQANSAAIKAFEVCGVDYTKLDPNFTGLFFMPDDYRAQVFGDGVLATATFALPADAQVGDEWYVGIVNDTADVSDTDNNDVAFVLDDGYIKIIPKLPAYEEETFPADQFTINMQGVTVAEGTEEITLDIEFYGNNADNNVKGVWATRVFVYYPQEIELLGFENGKIYEDHNMNVGMLNDNILNPKLTNSAGVPQANSAAIKAFEVCGVDYTKLDPNFTGLFYMPDDYRAQVFGDGTLATVTFKLPADAKAGTEWYVGIVNDTADVSDTDNNDVAFVLNDGYIKVYGANACDHAETVIEGAIAADCVNSGYTGDKVCAACGELIEAGSEIAALGHTAGEKEIVVEPTYTTEGSYVIKCSVCGAELETGIIPVLVKPAVTVGTVEGTIGKEVKVPVTIDNNGGLFIASFTVNYDAALTYAGFEIGDVFAADNVLVTETGDGELVLYFEALDVADVTANGTLINLVFAVDEEAAEGTAAISITANADDCINAAGENVAIDVADGAVEMVYPQSIVVEDVEVEYKKDAVVPVVIASNPGVWAIRAEIAIGDLVIKGFNDGLFALVEGENYSIADGVLTVFLEGAALENIADDAALFEIIFDLDGAEVGTTADIAIKLVEVIDADGNDLDFVAKAGTITVIPCAHDEVTATETKAPSVYEEGVISYICNNCGETVLTEAIPALAGIEVSEFISAKAGEQVAVDVALLNNPGVWALSATFAFDANVLELADVTSGLFAADEFSYSVANGVVTVYVESADLADVADDGVAFTLVFNALTCGYVDIDVELVAENTINAAGENVALECVDGSIISSCALTYVEAVEPGCHQSGSKEYWYCETCEAVYSDADGRYITNRKNLYIPATAELAYVEAVEASCHQNGSAAYYYCTECDAVFDEDMILTNRKNLTIPATAEIVYVEAVEPGCCQNGNSEYWYCADCDAVFADAALTQLTNRKNVIIPATAEIEYVEAVEAGCHQNGMAAYYYCTECDAVYDESFRLTNRKSLTILATADIMHVAAVEASCHQTGNVEYWFCSECAAVFTDAALTQLSNFKSVIIPAEGSLTFVDEVAATCHQKGIEAYWYCEICDAVFADASGRILTNRKNLTIPATAEIIYVEAIEPGCHYIGNTEYWYCADCDAVFADAALTIITNRKNVIVPELGGDVVHVDAVEATCHQNGNIEYWYCAECEQVWADEARTQLTNIKNVVTPATAEIIYVEAVEPSCCQNGNNEYWYCADCDAVFADAALTQLTNRKNVIIPATAEIVYVEAVEASCCQNGSAAYYYCSECDAVYDEDFRLTNRKNLTIPATAEIIYVEAVEPSCCQNGSAAYYYCSECDAVYDEDFRLTNRKNLTIPATAEIIYVEAVEAGCHQYGMAAYYYCTECDAVFDEDFRLTNRKNLVILPENELVYVPQLNPTVTENGHYEYWYCPACDAVFTDAAGTQLTNRKNLTIEKATFVYNAAGKDNAASFAFDGQTINVVSKVGVDYIKFAVEFGEKLNIAGENVEIKRYPTYAFITVAKGAEDCTFTLTDKYGNSVVYEINVTFDETITTDVIAAHTTESFVVDGNVYDITSKLDSATAAIGFRIASGVTYEVSEGVEIVKSGAHTYFKVAKAGTYYVTFNANGTEVVYTLNFTFTATVYTEVINAHSSADFAVDGNKFTVYAKDGFNNSAIGFKLKSGCTIVNAEGLDIVKSGAYTYVKAYAKNGSTYSFTIQNAAGVAVEYTIEFVF